MQGFYSREVVIEFENKIGEKQIVYINQNIEISKELKLFSILGGRGLKLHLCIHTKVKCWLVKKPVESIFL